MCQHPSDYSYFEPTVHTYASTTVEGNTVELKGYAQRGTDNIASQGFIYWPSDGANVKAETPQRIEEVPDDAQTVTAKGTIMTVTLKNLAYNTTYSYIAFVTTSEGETFYGEEMSFTTGDDPTGILPIEDDKWTNDDEMINGESSNGKSIYDVSGRRIAKMHKGINIVRYSDGTTRKVLKK